MLVRKGFRAGWRRRMDVWSLRNRTPAHAFLSLHPSAPQARAGARSASGTPLSVLDPPGSTTIEQAYARIDDKLKVRSAAGRNSLFTREAGGVSEEAFVSLPT